MKSIKMGCHVDPDELQAHQDLHDSPSLGLMYRHIPRTHIEEELRGGWCARRRSKWAMITLGATATILYTDRKIAGDLSDIGIGVKYNVGTAGKSYVYIAVFALQVKPGLRRCIAG